MIHLKLKFTFLVFLTFLLVNKSNGQDQSTKKEIIIVKEIVDENGEKTTEETILTGKEAEAYMEENGIEEGELEKEVSVKKWIDKNGKEHEITEENLVEFLEDEEISAEIRKMIESDSIDPKDIEIKEKQLYKIIKKDDEGNEEILEWDGTGEMPEEMKELIEKEGIQSMTKKVEIDVDKEDSNTKSSKTIKIKMNKNGVESEEIIELKDGEELPDDIRMKLEENGIDVDDLLKQDVNEGTKSKKIKIEKTIEKDSGNGGRVEIDFNNPNEAQIGIIVEDRMAGIYIVEVEDGTPANKEGVISGDVIKKINDQSISKVESLLENLNSAKAGEKINLTISRGGQEINKKITLIENEASNFSTNINLLKTEEERAKCKDGTVTIFLTKC